MQKKAFQAESQRLMDLMIHSIYTHKEIFLRELISNASDAIDKLAYLSLTDEKVGLNRDDFQIVLCADKNARTLTLSDNGIGMNQEQMESNLGTIAKSGSYQFKQDNQDAKQDDIDIIGQFGVGFYSAFMVADKLTVTSRAYGESQGYRWESEGIDGYTIEACDKADVGTEIVMTLKADAEDEDYSSYLEENTLLSLIRKYSDYIRYPIRMEVSKQQEKPKPENAPEDYQPEYETIHEWETVNSMVPLWQRRKSEVSEEEYQSFYREKFLDWEKPLAVQHIAVEGNLEYKALLYLPARAPMDYYTTDFKRGLQLYSSGVMIMEHCEALLPEYFSFMRGVVDSPDLSLNISRELLQHDRQLKLIANNLEKKIKSELVKMMQNDREKYETFFDAFGVQLKYALLNTYGANKDQLQELLLFYSSHENKRVSLKEYQERMPESQQYVYFASAPNKERAASLPQAERILKAGYEVLYLVAEEDELLIQILQNLNGKEYLSVADEKALAMTEAEKSELEQAEESHKALLDFVKETLGERVASVQLSKILQSGAVCLTSDGPISIEMEKYFSKMKSAFPMTAGRVLELNPHAQAFQSLNAIYESDVEKAKNYVEILYNQALLIADLPLPDPVKYAELVCGLM